ncbi:MAG: hypothetical protein K2P93_05550 [Alphaproteobacteria bacterium]|nr:hypothetical protein [Alphaproteobacteria bacterium]
MSIIYRATKGAPLSADEIDGNFKELEERLTHLEEHPERGEGIGKIQVVNDQMTLIGTFGSDFGTFYLPKASLNPCGSWTSQIPYQKLDLVTYENTLYCCVRDHVSTTWTQDEGAWKDILSLPKPSSNTLPLYEKATLPREENLGKLALLLEEEGLALIFFNGKTWQRLLKGDNL